MQLEHHRTETTYKEQFARSTAELALPPGFVRYHRENLARYLALPPDAFPGRRALDTGCGPGKHAAVLASMGASVTAVDLLDANVEATRRLAEANHLDNLTALRHDLTEPLPDRLDRFDLVVAHNWLMHASDPARVLALLAPRIADGGRLYLSVYQAGTFRFFINQLARGILRWDDRPAVQALLPAMFPEGFDEFRHPDDIALENIFDDFFVPFMGTFHSDDLVAFLGALGFDPLVPPHGRADLWALDNIQLKLSFVKRRPARSAVPTLPTVHDEFQATRVRDPPAAALVTQTGDLAREVLDKFRGTGPEDRAVRAAFCLGLYRLRGAHAKDADPTLRHRGLQGYLRRTLTGNLDDIAGWATSTRFYDRPQGRP